MNQTYEQTKEKLLRPPNGLLVLVISILLFLGAVTGFVFAVIEIEKEYSHNTLALIIGYALYFGLFFPMILKGLKVIKPNEASVYVLFGKYKGTIAKAGFFWINPFCSSVSAVNNLPEVRVGHVTIKMPNHTISLKATTLNNEKQKVNDKDGNPIEIGAVVIWRVVNATKAVFEVDNYQSYVSVQCDATIRHVVRKYPYDISDEGDEMSLRGSSSAVADEMKNELQNRVSLAGIEIMEVRIAHLAYAQEIAAAMLQRQQATAIIAARQKIVEGAVGMVEMALDKLSEREIVKLDDDRKAAMVSNLLVVLCGNKDAQPVVNSGNIA